MLKPFALDPGASIALVAPASRFSREEFDRGVDEIRRLGFVPVYDDRVFDTEPRGYLAGSPAVRTAALEAAWQDDAVRGIMAVRGGYGSAQLLPLLDAAAVRRARKVFIGYSDLTAVLNWSALAAGLVAFHGPMLAGRLSRGAEGYDRRSLLDAVSRREPIGELAPDGMEVLIGGEAAGPLLGGTLTQVAASLGTPYAFDPPGGFVLFIDEVNERPYRLDRMMTQLAQAGVLARAAAIVVNELPGCDEPGGQPTARAVMADLLAEFPGPAVIGFPSGHAIGPAMTLPFGVSCRVIAGSRPRLIIEEAAVE